MLLLAIETSCDETSAAVVEDGRVVRSNVVSSQIALHAPFGGVVPEIASRRHVQVITNVVAQALADAGVSKAELDGIAATRGPGLAGALLVGVSFARGMALGLKLPFIPVNHLEGHVHSVWLVAEETRQVPPTMPMLALIVSGGHTELVLMRDHGDYTAVGHTLDDAAGEAFDKVARLLGLSYPGGPAIQRTAAGADEPVRLPQALLPGTFNFSFSGLKTAVLHTVYSRTTGDKEAVRGVRLPKFDVASGLSQRDIKNIAAGFQESVVETLVSKTNAASQLLSVHSVAVVGGVAANASLRKRMSEVIQQPLFISPPEFSTDNAAMIASAAYFARPAKEDADIEPGLLLATQSNPNDWRG
ncbi:MAG: tRNA (adenosine(37)-N6)-threonylcarbamoyltransferase complex transferase subunit TsaD [Chloroflexota bacterium]